MDKPAQESRRDPTMDEICEIAILAANEDAVIVGGMAVSILANAYGITSDRSCMTQDADFLGGRLAIEDAVYNLSAFDVKEHFAKPRNVNSPNSGVIDVIIDKDIKPVHIDFLFHLDGLSTDEIEQKAVEIEVDGKQVKVIHPLLLIENKINNLALYPHKRNEAGINQAWLAVNIAKNYLSSMLEQVNNSERSLLRAAERIMRFTQRDAACFAYNMFSIDPLSAIPLDQIKTTEFHEKRWPQIMEKIENRRLRFGKILEKLVNTNKDPMTTRFRI